MTFFDEKKSILENLYLLSGPLIFIVTLFGLRQLKIAKESIKINSQRQSAILAFDLCEKYIKDAGEVYDVIVENMETIGVDYKIIEQMNLHNLDEISNENESIAEFNKLKEKYDEIQYYIIQLADILEAFSIPFIRRIADEELAYNSEFLKFYQYCNICAVEIITTRTEKPDQKAIYENMVELYSIWKSRNEKEKINHQVARLVKTSNSIKIKKIKPIGTE